MKFPIDITNKWGFTVAYTVILSSEKVILSSEKICVINIFIIKCLIFFRAMWRTFCTSRTLETLSVVKWPMAKSLWYVQWNLNEGLNTFLFSLGNIIQLVTCKSYDALFKASRLTSGPVKGLYKILMQASDNQMLNKKVYFYSYVYSLW